LILWRGAKMELEVIFSVIIFIVSLLLIIILYSLISRTVDKIKSSFIIILISIFFLILSESIFIINIENQTLIINIVRILFIILLITGFWQLRSVFVGLSDFGQFFVIISKDKYPKELISSFKSSKKICYITLEKPYTKIINQLTSKDIDTSSIHFIDGSGEKCESENCFAIKNNPTEIKNILDRKLREESFNSVIIDNIHVIKDIKSFEIPIFIQDIASLIKQNESQGFFIGNKEKINKEIINDISMLVDKVIGG
jgi:hypothetical protein